MVDRRREVSVAVALGVALAGGGPVRAQDPGIPVVVQVADRVGVGQWAMAAAKAVVDRMFRDAGVSLVWEHGAGSDAVTAVDSSPRVLTLVISKQRVACAEAACEHFDGVLGRAFPNLGRAEVFVDQIDAVLGTRPFDSKVVLGQVIAHEIGHLLLPPRSHSASGIMQSRIDLRLRGGFTRDQARLIRERLGSGTGNVQKISLPPSCTWRIAPAAVMRPNAAAPNDAFGLA